MGTKFAPVYATVAIAFLKEKLCIKITNEFVQEYTVYFEKIYILEEIP